MARSSKNILSSLAVVLAALLLFQTGAYAIGPSYSGSWFNPEQDGHGFSLEYVILNDGTPIVVAYWYVYDSQGNPIFLVGQGEAREDNSVLLEFIAPHGMKFGEFKPEQVVREDGGTGVFNFENPDAGAFVYEPSAWMVETYGVSAISIPVIKLVGVALEDPLPTDSFVDTYFGSWTGKMVYDRSSTGICDDAEVHLQIGDYPRNGDGWWRLVSITVIRDNGGQATFNWGYLDAIFEGSFAAEFFRVFDEYIDMNIQFPQIGAEGHAEGYWNYRNVDCYGQWTFTKD